MKSGIESSEKIVILKKAQKEETNLEAEHLLQDILMELWALSSVDIGKMKLAAHVRITIDNTLPPLVFVNIL